MRRSFPTPSTDRQEPHRRDWFLPVGRSRPDGAGTAPRACRSGSATTPPQPRMAGLHRWAPLGGRPARPWLVDRLEVDAQSFRHPRAPTLDEHVGGPEQPEHRLFVSGLVEVEHDAPFAPIENRILRGEVLATTIAAGRLHPDDIGTIV